MKRSFKRYEKKYYISKETRDRLIEIIKPYMYEDKHCKDGARYLVRNIYYDTDDNYLIHHSVLKPNYKAKLRVRKYGEYGDNQDQYFLEIKRKIDKIVAKRRIKLTKQELDDLIKNYQKPIRNSYIDNQIIDEITYFISLYKVKPICYISYERLAFFAKDDEEFRITFDENIIGRRQNLDFDSADGELSLIKDDYCIMEIKIIGAVPLWFSKALSELKIYPHSFSKYGTDYEMRVTKGELQHAR